MKHNIFTYMRNLAAAALAVLLLASCSILGADSDSAEPAAASDGKKVTVRFALADTARSAFPTINCNDFIRLELTCDGEPAEIWINDAESGLTAYQMLLASAVELTAGSHSFELTGYLSDGTTYSDRVTQTVSEGSVVSFTLSLDTISGNGTGRMSYTISYPSDSVTKITRVLYRTEDGKTYDTSTTYATSSTTSNLNGTWSGTVSTISAGLYVMVLEFYGGSNRDILLGSWEDVVGIISGRTTTYSKTLTSLNRSYTITYHLNGGSISGSSSTTTYTQYYSTMNAVTLKTPAKTGRDFAGWFANEDFTGTPAEGWSDRSRVGNLDLYAKWTYTVHFDGNASDEEPAEGSMESLTALEGAPVTLTRNTITREGYMFKNWNTLASPSEEAPGTAYEDGSVLTGTVHTTLYAQWKEKAAGSVAVSFIANGGTMVEPVAVAEGTAMAAADIPVTTRTGYTFAGWHTAETLAADSLVDLATWTPSEDVTLYAKWTANTYNVTYYLYVEGGSPVAISTELGTGTPVTHTYNTATTLVAPVREDYTYSGWHLLNEDGSLGAVVTSLSGTGYTADIALYTTWVQTNYYVTATGDNSTGTGLSDAPYATVTNAISRIKTVGSSTYDYTIIVDGVLTERISITATGLPTTSAKSLTIRGKTGNSTDKIDGSAGGTVLETSSPVPLTLADITITNGQAPNRSTGAGSGITYSASEGRLTLASGALITGNRSVYTSNNSWSTAGGIYISGGTVIMEEGAEISDNEAYHYGGALQITSNGSFIMNGGTISQNTAETQGGAIYCTYSSITMNGGEIVENDAPSIIYYYASSTFTMNGGSVSDNTGHGIYAGTQAVFTMNDGEICDNTGHGLYLNSDSTAGTAELKGGTISGNSVCNAKGTLILSGSISLPADSADHTFIELAADRYITIAGALTASSPVATVKKTTYSVGSPVFAAASGVTLTNALLQQFTFNDGGTPWNLVIEDEARYVRLRRPVYTVTYLEQNGDAVADLPDDAPETHTYGTATTLPVLSRDGYVFLGWYVAANGTGTRLTSLAADGFRANVTLYAAWAEQKVSVTVVSSDISVTSAENAGVITLTPASGYTDWRWTVGGTAATSVISGATVSSTGVLSFTRASLTTGRSYQLVLTAKNANGKTFMTVISIKK